MSPETLTFAPSVSGREDLSVPLRTRAAVDEEQLRCLMVRYQQADRAAIELLVETLSPMLTGYLCNHDVRPAEREDILQDCWLRIHRSRHTYLPSQPVLPWIFAIARHTRLDAYRRRRRKEGREFLVAEVPEPASSAAPPETGVFEMLDRLPEGQREVLLMLKVVGLSLEEIAAATSSSIGAVKQKAHRAYKTLRVLLEAGRK